MARLDRLRAQLAPGSQVLLTLTDGTKARGAVVEIDDDVLVLAPEDGLIESVLIDQLIQWKVLKAPPTPDNADHGSANEDATPLYRRNGTEAGSASEYPSPSLVPTAVSSPGLIDDSSSPLMAKSAVRIPELEDGPQSSPKVIPAISGPEPTHDPSYIATVKDMMLKIEAKFDHLCSTARLEVRFPETGFTSQGAPDHWKERMEAKQRWEGLKNKLESAKRIGELADPKFGRIHSLISDYRSYVEDYQASASARRLLAFCLHVGERNNEALEALIDLARACREEMGSSDWLQMASVSQFAQNDGIACFALEHYFTAVAPTPEPAWFLYLRLLSSFRNYEPLHATLRMFGGDSTSTSSVLLRDSLIYLLKSAASDAKALQAICTALRSHDASTALIHSLPKVGDKTYRITASAALHARVLPPIVAELQSEPLRGTVTEWKHSFGFILGNNRVKYFFHRTAVIDDHLASSLTQSGAANRQEVFFQAGTGPKGPIADKVLLAKSAREILEDAVRQADDGEYAKAAATAKQALALDPESSAAQSKIDSWTKWAMLPITQRGSGPWARAERAKLVEKDLPKAESLYRRAIEERDRFDTAVKDLGMLLIQMERPLESIQLLNTYRNRVAEPDKVDGILHGAYAATGQHVEAAEMLKRKLPSTSTGKRAALTWQMANHYVKGQEYGKAESTLREILKKDSSNLGAARLLAACLMRQDRLEDAEHILRNLIDNTSDAGASELLDALLKARKGGQDEEFTQILIATETQEFAPGLSKFAQFFLSRCRPTGTKHLDESGRYTGDDDGARRDIAGLREVALQLRARGIDPSSSYLSGAKIGYDLGLETWQRDLVQAFQSRGDVTAAHDRDSAWDWHIQALLASGDSFERVNTPLIQLLFMRLRGGRERPNSVRSLSEAISFLMEHHEAAFLDSVANVLMQIATLAEHLLGPLHRQSTWQVRSLQYLAGHHIPTPSGSIDFKDFLGLWATLRSKMISRASEAAGELFGLRRMEITTASLHNALERLNGVKAITDPWFLTLDQQRLSMVRRLIQAAIGLCDEPRFEEKDRQSAALSADCKLLLEEMEAHPTKLSIEDLYPVISRFTERLVRYIRELYDTSTPQLEIQPIFETYTVNDQQQIVVQIEVHNRPTCSPTEAFEIQLASDPKLFSGQHVAKVLGSLRGDGRELLELSLRLTDDAVRSEGFPVRYSCRYKYRTAPDTERTVDTAEAELYVILESGASWVPIPNPYQDYVKTGAVKAKDMFFGRDALIESLAAAILSTSAGKGVVIWGQKRSGKSSVQWHLMRKLAECPDLLVVELPSLTGLFDESSDASLFATLLWTILEKTIAAINYKVSHGLPWLQVVLPDELDFYKHPAPLTVFNRFFDALRQSMSQLDAWQLMRTVVTIDEFSQAYTLIADGRLSSTFMKNWKAMLEADYFKAVLVGQDIMERIKDTHANESASMQFERVDYLSREDAFELMDRPIRVGGRDGKSRYRGDAQERIFRLTAGNPFYIQFFCHHLVLKQNAEKLPYITKLQVDKVLSFLLNDPQTPLSRGDFDNLFDPRDREFVSAEDALTVLASIAKNSTGELPCLESAVDATTSASVSRVISELVQRKVLQREREGAYSIRVGLFREWLTKNL